MSSWFRRAALMTTTSKASTGRLVIAHCAFLAAAGAYSPRIAPAADWTTKPRVEVAGVYDDNYLLSRGAADPLAVSGAEVDARLQFSGATPRSETNLTPR